MEKELTPEQAKAAIKAMADLEEAINAGWEEGIGLATRALYKDQLNQLKKMYPEEELARTIYGDDYQ